MSVFKKRTLPHAETLSEKVKFMNHLCNSPYICSKIINPIPNVFRVQKVQSAADDNALFVDTFMHLYSEHRILTSDRKS